MWEAPIHVGGPQNRGNCHTIVSGGGLGALYSTEAAVRANACLIAAAPELLLLARKLASECAECGGSAEKIRAHGSAPEDEYAEPCAECADIWTVINKAEGRS